MEHIFSEEAYQELVGRLFSRFPSFQKVGAGAYKPGIANMEFADQLMGHPHRQYKIIHVAGTNGKGSVSNMLTSVLASCGHKVGLYTSPHILDFRERIRVVSQPSPSIQGNPCHVNPGESEGPVKESIIRLISKEYIWDFVHQWQDTFDHLDMSFFEITTLLALNWFASENVDIVVLETGLGGRLDSTNIVTPVLSVITNIGLDHCDMLGETLPEIAFEKAGIIKPCVPVVVGESGPEIDAVFERKVLYTNLAEPEFMGDRTRIMSLLTFADKVQPTLWDRHEEILAAMDLQGEYQSRNLRTVLAVLDVAGDIIPANLFHVPQNSEVPGTLSLQNRDRVIQAIAHTAARTDFHGRWEKLSDNPYTICDIGHNEHGLKYNFAQLTRMMDSGKFSRLILVYGSVADKDVDAVLHLLPENAVYVFTQADSRRALPVEKIREKYMSHCRESGRPSGDVHVAPSVAEALETAACLAAQEKSPLIYIGGSTYVVSEAVSEFKSSIRP